MMMMTKLNVSKLAYVYSPREYVVQTISKKACYRYLMFYLINFKEFLLLFIQQHVLKNSGWGLERAWMPHSTGEVVHL